MNFLEFLLVALAFQRRDDRLGGSDECGSIRWGNPPAAPGHDFPGKRSKHADGGHVIARVAILEVG